VFADFAEKAVLNRIPLGCAGGVMTNGDLQIKSIDDLFLKRIFPSAHSGAVATATIGQNQQLGGVGFVPRLVERRLVERFITRLFS
jgi:hypothetical protein